MADKSQANPVGQRLKVWTVPFDQKINDDFGSGANQDLDTWKPALKPGYYYLGPSATNSPSEHRYGVIVRELVDGTLVDIDGWKQVWNDAGSGKSTDYALWRGVCEDDDYVSLASYFTRSHNPPSADETQGIKAVLKGLLFSATSNPQIWTDAGTGASQDGSVWAVEDDPNPKGLETGAFVAASGHGVPPTDVYILDRSKVLIGNDADLVGPSQPNDPVSSGTC